MKKRVLVLAALGGLVLWRKRKQPPRPVTGRFLNGMEYARWGTDPRKVVWIPGGPGSEIPSGRMAAMSGSQFTPLLDAGFSVWLVSRKRNMPEGHTIQDMADDYAQVIREEFGGQVEAVVGLSYGGLIMQYLAADHPECMKRAVIALAATQVTEWGRDVDRRWAEARIRGDWREAGATMAEYVFPDPGQVRQRQLLGPLFGRAFKDDSVPAGDLRVEAEAEVAFDGTDAAQRIGVPVLLVSAEKDLFFPPDLIRATVAAIPQVTAVEYPGMGHLRAAVSTRLAKDVAAFAS